MKTRFPIAQATLCLGVLSAAIAFETNAAEFRTSQRPIAGQYIVVLKETAGRLSGEPERTRPAMAQVSAEVAASNRAVLLRSFAHVLRGFVVRADAAALARLMADPRVASIEEDGEAVPMQAVNVQQNPTWGIDRVDQRSVVLDHAFQYEAVVARPHVYIIDTGIYTGHSEFTGRMGNGVSFVNDGRGTGDCHGHGTHVAGTAAGTTWGVAKNAIVHPVRVMSCTGTASFSNLVAAMDWVAANRIFPAVANMSFGATQPTPSLDTAAQNLINAGVTLVVSAGNQNVDACQFSPGRVAAVINVGATQSNDARWSSSAYGSCVDVFAPGVGIRSAGIASTTAAIDDTGTSMAAPHVAGAIARYLNIYPATTPAQMSTVLNGAATPNVVINPGTGSPNRLLYIPPMPGTAPTITSYVCPDYANSGGNMYWCSVAYSSAVPTTVRWPGGSGSAGYQGFCTTGSRPTVSVSVTNAYGAVTRASTFLCPSGAIP